MKKYGFTVIETIVTLTVIAVLIMLSVAVIHPGNKAIKVAYARVYSALSNATLNYMLENSGNFPKNAQVMCEVLSDVINIAGGPKSTGDKFPNCKNYYKSSKPGSIKVFDDKKYSIKTVNGIKMWLEGNSSGAPFVLKQKVDDKEVKVNFYVVYADLNSDMGPNSAKWHPEVVADIVAYILTDDSTIIPIGYAEVDSRYVSANVVKATENESGDIESYTPVSYYEAKKAIWGDKIVDSRVQTFDFQSMIPNDSLFKMISGNSTKENDYKKYFKTVPKNTECDQVDCELKIYDCF